LFKFTRKVDWSLAQASSVYYERESGKATDRNMGTSGIGIYFLFLREILDKSVTIEYKEGILKLREG
jgi:hypothetical protein